MSPHSEIVEKTFLTVRIIPVQRKVWSPQQLIRGTISCLHRGPSQLLLYQLDIHMVHVRNRLSCTPHRSTKKEKKNLKSLWFLCRPEADTEASGLLSWSVQELLKKYRVTMRKKSVSLSAAGKQELWMQVKPTSDMPNYCGRALKCNPGFSVLSFWANRHHWAAINTFYDKGKM